MSNEFTTVLNRMLSLSGKSISQVAALAGIDRSFCLRIFSGERMPSHTTLLRVYVALVIDPKIVAKSPTMIHGFEELVLAAATVPAKPKHRMVMSASAD